LPIRKEHIVFQYSLNNHHQNSVYGIVSYIATQSIGFSQFLWDKKLTEKNTLLVGLPLRYTYYDDNTPGTGNGDSINPQNQPQRTFLPGIFLQDDLRFSARLTSLIGLRYDYNSDHGSIFSPRISFKLAHNENNIIRLSGGNGYRVVNLFTEDHAALTGSRQVVVTEDLKPERSWNVNVNYQKFIHHKKGFVGLDMSLFYTYFNNKIVGDFLTDPQKIIYDNLKGYAVSRGFTMNSEFSFVFPLKITMGFTLMDVFTMNRNEDGIFERIPQMHAPKFSGTFAVSYKFNKAGITIDYTGRVMGPMELPVVVNDFRSSKSPWFSLQNIQVTKSVRRGLEIYGGVKNLFNFIPKDPLLRPFDPFDKYIGINNPNGYTFDTTYNYAPIQGIRGFLGVRWIVAGKE
jgi:outer membrane receptor for ferrienterochelin and colicins